MMAHDMRRFLLTCCIFGLTFATLVDVDDSKCSGLLAEHGDEINMLQTAIDLHVAWPQPKLMGATTVNYFDKVPVYGYNRIRKNGHFERNDWMVVFPQTYTHTMLVEACARLPAPAKCSHIGHPDTGGLAIITVSASEIEMRTSKMYACTEPGAQFIELDGTMHIFNSPQTQRREVPWGLDRIDSDTLDGKYTITDGGKNIHVYHLDTGVTKDLAEFGGRVIAEWDATPSDPNDCRALDYRPCKARAGVSETCGANCAIDRAGHGTGTAGVLAGDDYGVARLATIHAMKVLMDNGEGSWSFFINALDYVMEQAKTPVIVSASLGGEGILPIIETAINAATKDGKIIVVVAAGNNATNACDFTPAFAKSALTVGSTDKQDELSEFSNYGPCVDIYAPGTDIASLSIDPEKIQIASGTSMSTPFVSGVLAIKMAQNSDMDAVTAGTKVIADARAAKLKGMDQPGTKNKLLYVQPKQNHPGGKVIKTPQVVPKFILPSSYRKNRSLSQKSVVPPHSVKHPFMNAFNPKAKPH